jgi:futalosine hydrolase
MKLLIVAATAFEVAPFRQHIQDAALPAGLSIEVLVTGVGMMATTYALTRHLSAHTYDLVLQAGVGGSYKQALQPGDMALVVSEQYGDLGAEDHDAYLDIFEMGLIGADEPPHAGRKLLMPLQPIHNKIMLPHATGLTVNTVSGSEATILRRTAAYQCDIESMEGAALHYVCLQEQVAFAQVRAISNYVTPRDRSQWKMKEAIINLNNWLISFIDGL